MRSKIFPLLLVVALSVTPLAGASPASAPESSFCGGSLDQGRCQLRYAGGDVTVTAATAGIVGSDVTVRLELPRKHRRPLVLLECSISNGGEASGCTSRANEVAPSVRSDAKLRCVVAGRAEDGVFGCTTGA